MATQPSEPWWRPLETPKQPEQSAETVPIPSPPTRWRSDPGDTRPDDIHQAEMPLPPRSWEELERAGVDPSNTTTWRPAVFSRRRTPMPARRIGTLTPAPIVRPSQAPRPQTPRLTVPPPSPVSVTLAEWFARMGAAARDALHPAIPDAQALDEQPRRYTNPPSDPRGARGHAEARAQQGHLTPPPQLTTSRRYSDEEILRHRELVRMHGWQDFDPRCRGCHAYDVRPQHYPEHEIMNWLCLNCQNWLYSATCRHTPGDKLVIFRRVWDILRDPRRTLNMTSR